jgi:hypothetical protein
MTKLLARVAGMPPAQLFRSSNARSGIAGESGTSHWVIETETPFALQADEADSGLREPWRTIAIASVLSAMALVVLDAAVANVALPTIGRSLHVTPAMSVLIVTAYQTALVMGLLLLDLVHDLRKTALLEVVP